MNESNILRIILHSKETTSRKVFIELHILGSQNLSLYDYYACGLMKYIQRLNDDTHKLANFVKTVSCSGKNTLLKIQ